MSNRRNDDPNLLMTRREFTAASAAIGAAAVFASPVFARSHLRNEQVLKVGLIGCGGRGTGAAVQALQADPGAVLWAMGDVFSDKIDPCLGYVKDSMLDLDDEQGTDTWSKKIQVDESRKFSGFDAIDKVLASDVDVVLLTTPPAFRPEHLHASVEAGKHVFCEKPVAVDSTGVRSVLESARIARERSLSLMSGFCWRYQDQVKETFEKILSGGIGDVHTIQTTYNTTGWVQPQSRKEGWSDAEFQLRNWQYFTPLSADHVAEQAVHAIDWQAWAMNDQPPIRCFAVGGRQTRPELPETGNVWDHFSVIYEYQGGVRAYHMCRHWANTPSDNSAYILGSEGACTMQPWNGKHEIQGVNPWTGSAQSNDMYQREHDVLFKSIRDGIPVNDGVRMSHSSLLAIMGRMAAYTGQSVTWEHAMDSEENLNQQHWEFGNRDTPILATPGKTKLI